MLTPERWHHEGGVDMLTTAHQVEVWHGRGLYVLMANYPGGPRHGAAHQRWAQMQAVSPLLGPDLQVRLTLSDDEFEPFLQHHGLASLVELAPAHFVLDARAEWYDEDFADGYLLEDTALVLEE